MLRLFLVLSPRSASLLVCVHDHIIEFNGYAVEYPFLGVPRCSPIESCWARVLMGKNTARIRMG